jgi:hypothetical protein
MYVMTSFINSAFLARRLWDLYAGEICSVYRARHRINHRNEESTARDDKPTDKDEFEDDNDNCRNEESTAMDDKPTEEDSLKMTQPLSQPKIHRKERQAYRKIHKFKDDNDDCRNEEFTARNDNPIVEDKFEDDKATVATKNPPQGTTSRSLKTISKTTTTTTVATKNPPQGQQAYRRRQV